MKRTPRGSIESKLPVPKASKGSPGNAKSTLSKGVNQSRSSEDLPRRVQLSLAGSPSPQRRAVSPGGVMRRGYAQNSQGSLQNGQAGVRYITEDLIRKMCKEDNLDMVTTLNLTLTKGEGGKKIKYIENLEKLKRLQVLVLNNNIIEKIEKVDKLLKLKELSLADNCIVKIEGLENLTNLQILNLTGNMIEHIPIWMGKRLKSLRTFHIGRNRLESLSELAKLKPLPDLTQLTVAENPLAEFNHCRSYLIFHIRSLEIIDGENITDRDRDTAKNRFEQDELERLEKQLENEEAKFRRLEEDHNRSQQERSHLTATEEDLRKREKGYSNRIEELERQLQTKDDLLKKKTQELNRACEKHYQIEQDLAFHKIDSKFDSLGRGPEQSFDESGDGLLGESPYIGRARYKANRFADESNILSVSPSTAQIHSLPGPVRAEVKMEINNKLDHEIAVKQDKVAKAEDRLKRLTDELQETEDKLRNAAKDLRGIGDAAVQDKEEQKQAIRQKMARKMRTVNEMKDSATQIEDELEKTKTSLHQQKMDMVRLKDQLGRMDNKDPNYRRVYADMVDKEQQINESNQMYGQLQSQLELMLDTVAKETNDIKRLEQQLNEDQIETNESLREELDDIVGGLQSYLAEVQTKAAKKEREFDQVLKEKEELHDRLRKMETELSVIDAEAEGLRELERKYIDMEQALHDQKDSNKQLQEQIHTSRKQDTQNQDYMEAKELEVAQLKKALKDLEQKAKSEKQTYEKQLQTEKAKAVDGDRKSKESQKKDEEMRKLISQLETVKAQNVALKDKQEQDTQTYQSRMLESTPNNELRRRLKELAQSFKNSKVSIEPEGEKDVLGKTFKDLQMFVHDKMNRSFKDADDAKNRLDKSDHENQSLRDQLKRAESKLEKRDEKVKNEKNKFKEELKTNQEEMRRLNEEVQRLRNALKEARNRAKQTKIVHDDDNESAFSRRSSLNSEEKHLFDQLQDELISLKRSMRNKEEDANKKIIDAETEAAMLEQKLDDQEESYQNEIKALKDHMELQKERQEARMQVIAADLDQAQQVADFLQRMLDDREQQLHAEINQADLSSQMINGQEDELSKLYDILEAQREEINRLNGMLDTLSGQGASLGTPGADDELWRLRQEVNNLKETLAMQSAYVQTMPPPSTSHGVQANTGTGTQYYLTDHGTAAGPVYKPLLSQYREQPLSMVPPAPGMASMGTSYFPPGYGTQSMGVGSGAGSGGADSPGGPEQGETITPPGGRPSTGVGRSRPSQSPIKRYADRGPVTGSQSPVRGATMAQTSGANEDTYLFCNVPEHHDLEDYIAELQEKLKKLRARIANEKVLQAEMQDDKDYNLIRRLQGELSERRDELEGLDLAIERQQKNLKNLKAEEKRLQFEREVAREDLEFVKGQNARRKKKTRVYSDGEDDFDERMENSRKNLLKDEIRCLEETLAKRKSQLREADRLLKECNTDLKCARDEARETVREYDKAAHGLESTVKETSELEKRANLAGIELIKATEKLNAIRRDTKDYESKRSKQEKLLRDVSQLITKRDADFKDLDNRSKATQQNLSRLQNELSAATQKERETVAALRESEDVLAKRRNEIARMRDQIDQQKHELEKVDHMMGKKRTELQFLTENVERKQGEINQLIRDTESELSANKREIKEQRDILRSMEVQKSELSSQLKTKRAELQKIKEEIETEEEVLQKLSSSVNKNKADLKHTFEMQRMEQTELDNLKSQHAQKLSELEKTQRELLDEKSDLDTMSSEMNKKSSEVERLRNIIERDRMECERLSMEKQSYEDRIATMTQEKEMLDETYKTMDTKIMQLKRSQNTMEEKVDSTSRRLQTLESELQRKEREMEEMDRQKAHLQKDVTIVKNNVKEGKHELKILKEQIRDAENKIQHMEQELRDSHTQRDEAKLEMERMNEQIRQSRLTHDDCLRQQKQREEELQDLIRTMDEREIEYQDTRKALSKVRKEVEKEESKLSKLVSTANIELDHIRTDLSSKQNELSKATSDIYNLKKEAEKLELDEQKLSEYEKQIRDLKQEVQDRNEEKNELAKALTRSYEELQKLRTESAQEQERLTVDRMQLENTLRDLQDQLDQNKRELQQMQKRSSAQVQELQALAEDQFNRANRLSEDLARVKSKKPTDQSQVRLNDVTNQVTGESKDDKQAPPTVELTDPQSENKENFRSSAEELRKADANLREKLAKEQEVLRLQLQQQMQRHADAMEQARLQSEGTLENLRKKLNTLQDVLVTSTDLTSPTFRRTRSRSAGLVPSPDRQRSPSPGYGHHGYLAQRPRSRSRSADRVVSRSLYPEREFLTV